MDKPTEHQPLDNFFRRKLTDASLPPGSESWSRLQSRLTEQPLEGVTRPIHWIGVLWYCAASTAASFLLLAFLWTNEDEKLTRPNAGKELADGKKSAKGTVQPRTNRTLETPAPKRSDVATESVGEPKAIEQGKSQVNRAGQQREYARRSKEGKSEETINVSPQSQIVKVTEKQPEPIQNKPVGFEKKELASESPRNTTTKPALINQERTLIVSVAEPTTEQAVTSEFQRMPSATFQAPVKNARIARVFRQIKRLKDGEALARVEVNPSETDDESGLVSRLVQATRSKENQSKQQK